MSTGTRLAGVAAAALSLAGILLVTSFWRDDAGGVTTLKTSTATYTVRLSTDGTRGGAGTFDLEIENRDGTPSEVGEVTLEPVMPQMGHAYPPVTATPLAPGRYRSMPTRWICRCATTSPVRR